MPGRSDWKKGRSFARAFTRSRRRALVFIDIHHINGDGASLELLREELFELYQALLERRQPALWPPAPVMRISSSTRPL